MDITKQECLPTAAQLQGGLSPSHSGTSPQGNVYFLHPPCSQSPAQDPQHDSPIHRELSRIRAEVCEIEDRVRALAKILNVKL